MQRLLPISFNVSIIIQQTTKAIPIRLAPPPPPPGTNKRQGSPLRKFNPVDTPLGPIQEDSEIVNHVPRKTGGE